MPFRHTCSASDIISESIYGAVRRTSGVGVLSLPQVPVSPPACLPVSFGIGLLGSVTEIYLAPACDQCLYLYFLCFKSLRCATYPPAYLGSVSSPRLCVLAHLPCHCT